MEKTLELTYHVPTVVPEELAELLLKTNCEGFRANGWKTEVSGGYELNVRKGPVDGFLVKDMFFYPSASGLNLIQVEIGYENALIPDPRRIRGARHLDHMCTLNFFNGFVAQVSFMPENKLVAVAFNLWQSRSGGMILVGPEFLRAFEEEVLKPVEQVIELDRAFRRVLGAFKDGNPNFKTRVINEFFEKIGGQLDLLPK